MSEGAPQECPGALNCQSLGWEPLPGAARRHTQPLLPWGNACPYLRPCGWLPAHSLHTPSAPLRGLLQSQSPSTPEFPPPSLP